MTKLVGTDYRRSPSRTPKESFDVEAAVSEVDIGLEGERADAVEDLVDRVEPVSNSITTRSVVRLRTDLPDESLSNGSSGHDRSDIAGIEDTPRSLAAGGR